MSSENLQPVYSESPPPPPPPPPPPMTQQEPPPSYIRVYTVKDNTNGNPNIKNILNSIDQNNIYNVIEGPQGYYALVGGPDLNTAVLNKQSFVSNPHRQENLESVLYDWKNPNDPTGTFYSFRGDVDEEFQRFRQNPKKFSPHYSELLPQPTKVLLEHEPDCPYNPVLQPQQQFQQTRPMPRLQQVQHTQQAPAIKMPQPQIFIGFA